MTDEQTIISKAVNAWAGENMRILGKVSLRDLNLLTERIAAALVASRVRPPRAPQPPKDAELAQSWELRDRALKADAANVLDESIEDDRRIDNG